jgi:AraC family transcriptional regulator of adaptative response/methylated-DNA-[protein]-cysteine methyltransferase
MDAGTFRRGGDGLAVGYAISQSDVGRLLLAATDRGVCFVGFGESDEELLTRLRYEFPRAKIAPARGHILIEWLRRIRDAVGRSDRGLIDLPLDVRGTAFQARVWQTIRSIPAGSTATYSEIANRMGEPRATRAVARACAGNPTAVIVPCHRVVRKDGSLGGYRWGSDRKAALLRMEGEREDV